MQNKFDIYLDHPNYNFDAGIISHEDMQVSNNNDRYQYNLPYYNYSTSINQNKLNGSFIFSSSGNNVLKNTNQLDTTVQRSII